MPSLSVVLLLLISWAATSMASTQPYETAIYTYGFDTPSPNLTELAGMQDSAAELAAADYNTIILAFLHARPTGQIIYNNYNLTDANGEINPDYSYLPRVIDTLKSRGASIRFSYGGWCNDDDWLSLNSSFGSVTSNLNAVLRWSGASGIDLDPEPCEVTIPEIESTIVKFSRWLAAEQYVITAAPYCYPKTWGSILSKTRDPITGNQMFSNFFCQLYGNRIIVDQLKMAIAASGGSAGTGITSTRKFLWPGWAPCDTTTWTQPAGPPCHYVAGRSAQTMRRAAESFAASHPGAGGAFLWNNVEFGSRSTGCPVSSKTLHKILMKGGQNPRPLDGDASCPVVDGGTILFGLPYHVQCPQRAVPDAAGEGTASASWLSLNPSTWALECIEDPSQRTPLYVYPPANRPLNPDQTFDSGWKLFGTIVFGALEDNYFGPAARRGQQLIMGTKTADGHYFWAGLNTTTSSLMLPTTNTTEMVDSGTFTIALFQMYNGDSTSDISAGGVVRMRVLQDINRPWCSMDESGTDGSVSCGTGDDDRWSVFQFQPAPEAQEKLDHQMAVH